MKRGRPKKYPTGSAAVSFTCPVETADAIAKEANKTGKSQSDIVTEWLQLGWKRCAVASMYARQLSEIDEAVKKIRDVLEQQIIEDTWVDSSGVESRYWTCEELVPSRRTKDAIVIGSYRDEPNALPCDPNKLVVGDRKRKTRPVHPMPNIHSKVSAGVH